MLILLYHILCRNLSQSGLPPPPKIKPLKKNEMMQVGYCGEQPQGTKMGNWEEWNGKAEKPSKQVTWSWWPPRTTGTLSQHFLWSHTECDSRDRIFVYSPSPPVVKSSPFRYFITIIFNTLNPQFCHVLLSDVVIFVFFFLILRIFSISSHSISFAQSLAHIPRYMGFLPTHFHIYFDRGL